MPFAVTMPKLSPTMTEGVVARWHKKVGEQVAAGDLLVEIATDKATVEYNALDEGWLRKITCAEGGSCPVNGLLAIFTETKDESLDGFTPEVAAVKAPTAASPAKRAEKAIPASSDERPLASPLAKKLAKERHVDLSAVAGSGPRGRVMSRDLPQPGAGAVSATAERAGMPAFVEETMTPMRKAIARRLQESKATIPHFYVRQEVDMQQVVQAREELKKRELNITVNDFILKACAASLAAHPQVNSGYDASSGTVLRYTRIDIAVAVTIDGGLITPIVTDCAGKSLSQLSQEVKALSAKAKAGKLLPHEFQGGSFTLSNLGMFGASEVTPIINPPQVSILGVGAIVDAPMVKHNQVVPGKKLTLTLACDHRVVDGATAAQFLGTVRQFLETPWLFLV